MSSDPERRLRELEAQVRAERAARLEREQVAMARARPAPAPTDAKLPPAAEPQAPRKGLRGYFSTFKRKAMLVAGVLVAGALTLWVLEKVFRIALYVGAAAAVAFAVWWFLFRKKT